MEKPIKENPMEEKLFELQKSQYRTKVGMSEILFSQLPRDKDIKFIALEGNPKTVEVHIKDLFAKCINVEDIDLKHSKQILKELCELIEEWKKKVVSSSECGDQKTYMVLSRCINDFYEIVHRTRKASAVNGFKNKNRSRKNANKKESN